MASKDDKEDREGFAENDESVEHLHHGHVGWPVVYHAPNGSDVPAVIAGIRGEHNDNDEDFTPKYQIVVINVPDNYVVDNVAEGEGGGGIEFLD